MSGSGRDDVWPPIEKGRAVPGADRLGLWLFLVSLGIPFLVLILVFFFMKAESTVWLPDHIDGIPGVLWLSTLSILAVSGCSHLSVRAIRLDHLVTTGRALLGAGLFAALFSLCQVVAWETLREAFSSLDEGQRRYKASFNLLTGFHALHVVGGLVLQAFVITRFYRKRYWSLHHPGIRYAALYWHFLDGLWLLILATLWIGA